MYRSYCVHYIDESSKVVLGSSKEDIRRRYGHLHNGIKGVFIMGISHIDTIDTKDTIDITTDTIDD
jgi:hypothetical protein